MIKKIIFIFIGLLITNYAYSLNNQDLSQFFLNFLNNFDNLTLVSILLSIGSYFIGVISRGLRIFYLSNSYDTSLRKLLYLQFLSTTFQLILPFRLGDGMRIYLLRNYLKGFAESAFIFVIEKLLDSLTLLSILLVVLWSNKRLTTFLSDSRLFILASIIFTFLYILPDLIDVLYRNSLVSKSNSKIRILFLRISKEILIARQQTINRLKGRVINVLCISYVIWAFDCLSFSLITSALKVDNLLVFLMGPLEALSGFLPSPPLGIYGSVTIGLYWTEIISGLKNITQYSSTYSIIVYGTFVIVTVIIVAGNKLINIFKNK